MSQIKRALEEIANCQKCNGHGWWVWHNGKDEYSQEPCECNPAAIPDPRQMA